MSYLNTLFGGTLYDKNTTKTGKVWNFDDPSAVQNWTEWLNSATDSDIQSWNQKVGNTLTKDQALGLLSSPGGGMSKPPGATIDNLSNNTGYTGYSGPNVGSSNPDLSDDSGGDGPKTVTVSDDPPPDDLGTDNNNNNNNNNNNGIAAPSAEEQYWLDRAAREAARDAETITETTTVDDIVPYEPPTLPPELPPVAPYVPPPIAAPAPYVAPAPYKPKPSETVSGVLKTLLNENSPYLQNAREAGLRSAQSRGLLNSSISAGSAQGAAIDRAGAIAQGDADIYTQIGMAGYQGRINAALAGQGYENQANLNNLQGQIESKLSAQGAIQTDYLNTRQTTLQGMISSQLSEQEARQQIRALEFQGLIDAGLNEAQAANRLHEIELQGLLNMGISEFEAQQRVKEIELTGLINSGLSTQEAEQAMVRIRYQGLLDSGLSEQQAQQQLILDEQQQIGANYRQQMELEVKTNIEAANLSATERSTVANAMNTYGVNFQHDLASIQSDPNLSPEAKTSALNDLQTAYQSNLISLGNLYEIEISWDIMDFSDMSITDTSITDNVFRSDDVRER